MNLPLIEDQTFTQLDFKDQELPLGEYEYCRFEQCNLEYAVLNNFKFIDCEFLHCNLSLAKIENTMFQNCTFLQCKLLGLQFTTANPFNISFKFDQCILDHSSFAGLKINKTPFLSCHIHEADFENTSLKEALFNNTDLLRSTFYHTALQKADFRTAYNFGLNPEDNQLVGAKFSLEGLPALLTRYKLDIQ